MDLPRFFVFFLVGNVVYTYLDMGWCEKRGTYGKL